MCVCRRANLRNYTSHRHQILMNVILWPWLGSHYVTLCTSGLWITSWLVRNRWRVKGVYLKWLNSEQHWFDTAANIQTNPPGGSTGAGDEVWYLRLPWLLGSRLTPIKRVSSVQRPNRHISLSSGWLKQFSSLSTNTLIGNAAMLETHDWRRRTRRRLNDGRRGVHQFTMHGGGAVTEICRLIELIGSVLSGR